MFTNIWGYSLNFVDSESFLESNSPDVLALCETSLNGSVDSGNFSVRGCISLIWKDSSTHMHGHTVHVKEGVPLAWDLQINSTDSYLSFLLTLLHSVLLLFLLSITFFVLCTFFYSLLSNVDEVLLINHLLMCLYLETLTSIIQTGLSILVELMDLVNSVIIFFISSNLTQMVNFPTRIPYCDSHSPALLNFFLLVLVVVLKWLSLHWDILIMLLS